MKCKLLIAAAVAASLFAARPAAAQSWKLGIGMAPAASGGSLITRVYPGSPAESYGLQPGDTLLTVNGQLATDPWQVRSLVFASDDLQLVIERAGGYYQLDVAFAPPIAAATAYATYAVPAAPKAVKSVKLKRVAKPGLPQAKKSVKRLPTDPRPLPKR